VLAATKKIGLLLKGTVRNGDYEKLQLAVVGLIRQVCFRFVLYSLSFL
jgi:hypothetical protein